MASLGRLGPVLAVGLACSPGSAGLDAQVASELSSAPRLAPGVVVDPTSELPAPHDDARSSDGLTVVAGPRDPRAALDVVRRFFRATLDESEVDLTEALDEHARIRTDTRGSSHRALDHWRQRFDRLEYGVLSAQVVFRERDVEVFRAGEVARLDPPRPRLGSPGGQDVLVIVPISTARHGRTRLYGDEISFLLRPSGTGYKIREMREEFELQ